jgi:hypothetical protein
MVFNSNHDDDGRSSGSSTCLPAGDQDVEENGDYAEEVDYSTVPPTPDAGRFLLSPLRTAATRYPLRSTPERMNTVLQWQQLWLLCLATVPGQVQ